jgi:hypothetical protein
MAVLGSVTVSERRVLEMERRRILVTLRNFQRGGLAKKFSDEANACRRTIG